jgi:hypothetical protein
MFQSAQVEIGRQRKRALTRRAAFLMPNAKLKRRPINFRLIQAVVKSGFTDLMEK